MASRAAKFISTVFASVLAGAHLTTMSPTAAEDCVTSPKGTAPEGQHWHYRLERGTKRQCWYLRGPGDKVSRPAAQAAASGSASTPRPDAGRSVEDAHAELTAWPVAAAESAKPALNPPAPASPQPTAATADDSPTSATAETSASDSVSPSPVVVGETRRTKQGSPISLSQRSAAPGEASPEKANASIPTLLLVIGGALAFAGLAGSMIYRLAGFRISRRPNRGEPRRVHWDDAADPTHAADPTRAPWRAPDLQAQAPLAVKEKLAGAPDQHERASHSPPASEATDARTSDDAPADAADIDVDEITAMLERLVKEGPRFDRPISAADSAGSERTRPGRPAVRA